MSTEIYHGQYFCQHQLKGESDMLTETLPLTVLCQHQLKEGADIMTGNLP